LVAGLGKNIFVFDDSGNEIYSASNLSKAISLKLDQGFCIFKAAFDKEIATEKIAVF